MDNASVNDQASVNSVRLVGRVSGTPVERQLPSGDHVVSFRVVVPRSAAVRRRTRQPVDTLECSVWTARLRRAAMRLNGGEGVVISGELRRSFRRGRAGVTSWVTVDVDGLQRAEQEPAE